MAKQIRHGWNCVIEVLRWHHQQSAHATTLYLQQQAPVWILSTLLSIQDFLTLPLFRSPSIVPWKISLERVVMTPYVSKPVKFSGFHNWQKCHPTSNKTKGQTHYQQTGLSITSLSSICLHFIYHNMTDFGWTYNLYIKEIVVNNVL